MRAAIKNEENEYIPLFSIRDIVKRTSHPRQRSIPPERNKKSRIETKHFAKNVQ